MYVIRSDAEILCSKEVEMLDKAYIEKFGERFIRFNYIDFPGNERQSSAEMYKEALQKALTLDEPTHIQSHRHDVIDH